MSATEGERNAAGSAPASVGATSDAGDASFTSAFDGGLHFVNALRRVATALVALAAVEAKLLRASIALVFLCSVALVAFSVSLWACVVALIGWALMVATGSVGIALAILVVLHLILVGLLWFAIKRAVHHASFPLTRDELGMLGRELRRDVTRFQHPSTRRDPGAPP